jgi:GST-like protein
MTDSSDYVPPQVWKWESPSGGQFASINRPVAGPTHDKELPVGKHPLQLYSLATPNGQKIPILLEELLAKGHSGAEYDAWPIRIGEGDQFSSGFVEVNPNSKILGGGFGHFFTYAPVKIEYAINRYAMEAKRQLDVLNRRLAESEFVAGPDYTIADIAIWPWYGGIALGRSYPGADEFLATHEYEHLVRWAKQIDARPAVARGRIVNKLNGEASEQLHERHDASDFEQRTQDKVEPEAVKDDAI